MQRESQDSAELRAMMATPGAKRWMGAFLDSCGLHASAYVEDPQRFAYRSGIQQAARVLENALFAADPALPGECREAYESSRKLSKQLKEEQEDE